MTKTNYHIRAIEEQDMISLFYGRCYTHPCCWQDGVSQVELKKKKKALPHGEHLFLFARYSIGSSLDT